VSVPLTAAMLALSRGDAMRALELLEPVRPYDHAPAAELWPSYVRGQAFLRAKNGAAAAAEFKNIIDHRGLVPVSLLYPLAHLGLARAAALTSDAATATASYTALLGMWSAGDKNLPPLIEAHREQAGLH
jgi:hypothetical protein